MIFLSSRFVGYLAAGSLAAACAAADRAAPVVPAPSPPSASSVPAPSGSDPGVGDVAPLGIDLGGDPPDGGLPAGDLRFGAPDVEAVDSDLTRAVLEASFASAFALVIRYDEVTSLLEGAMLVADECRRRFLPADPCACYDLFGDAARIAGLRAEALEALGAYGGLLDSVDSEVSDAGVAAAYAEVAADLQAGCFSSSVVEVAADAFEADPVVGGVAAPPLLPQLARPPGASGVDASADARVVDVVREAPSVVPPRDGDFEEVLRTFERCGALGNPCVCREALRALAAVLRTLETMPSGVIGLPPGIGGPSEVAAYLSLLDGRLAGACPAL